MDRNVTDHKIDTIINSFELYVEDNSDDDFQPVVTARKRKSRENASQSESQKRLKGKGKATDSEVTTTAVTILMHLSSKDPFLGELTKSAFRITKSTSAAVESSATASKTSLTSPKPSKPVSAAFKSAATSVKSSFCPVPVDKANDIKEGPKKISKRVMTIKTTFQGTLEIDGVGVSIIKQNTDTRNSPKPNTEKKVDGNQTEHIEGLGQADLKSTEGKCVLIDPGRRDLMYCMKEISTVEEKRTLIFTKNNRSQCSRHFRYLRKRTQPFVVQKAEAILSRSESNSVDLKKFVQYIKTRASVKNTLYEYYGNETTKSKHISLNLSLTLESTKNVISQLYATYLQTMLQQKHISEKLDDSEKSKVLGQAKEMYRRPQQNNYKKTISTALEKLQLLPFRKLKFSSKLFFDQNDQKLVRSLKAKFGQDAVLVFGDWSAPNVKYQEPTRSKGLIRMLKKNGFVVYLINEYKTSSHCPTCENELEKFKTVPNPRPYQRKKKPDVLCNGLLRNKKKALESRSNSRIEFSQDPK
ncbi:hypothetical protein G6F65_010181 [Rhizopus arrhizus]|nr:hypothetical protein G6F65_010181 [Rhizopus arrhizus]